MRETVTIRLPGEVRTEFVYPTIPSDALMCLGEVIAPADLSMPGAQDRQAVTFGEENRKAGADCRSKLGWVADFVATWPK